MIKSRPNMKNDGNNNEISNGIVYCLLSIDRKENQTIENIC